MEENASGSQSSEVHCISDVEKHLEEFFNVTFKGLKLFGHLNKSNAPEVKKIMLELFDKFEQGLGTEIPESKSNEEFPLNLEDNNLLLLPDGTKKDISLEIADRLNDSLEGNTSTNNELHEEEVDDHVDGNVVLDHDAEDLKVVEEGEISCSTENTGEICEEDEKDIKIESTVNSVLNAMKENGDQSPHKIKLLFQTKLKIISEEGVVPFVNKAFKECLENPKFLKTFKELIEISKQIGGEITSELKSETWKKCLQLFEHEENSFPESELGFTFSENSDDINKALKIIRKNFKLEAQTVQRHNIISLIGMLFHSNLVDLTLFSDFVCRLWKLASTTSKSFFPFLCSLLSKVGQQFENQLRQEEENKSLMSKIASLCSTAKAYGESGNTVPQEVKDFLIVRNQWKQKRYRFSDSRSPGYRGGENLPGTSAKCQTVENKRVTNQKDFKTKNYRSRNPPQKRNPGRNYESPINITNPKIWKTQRQQQQQTLTKEEIILKAAQEVLQGSIANYNSYSAPHSSHRDVHTRLGNQNQTNNALPNQNFVRPNGNNRRNRKKPIRNQWQKSKDTNQQKRKNNMNANLNN